MHKKLISLCLLVFFSINGICQDDDFFLRKRAAQMRQIPNVTVSEVAQSMQSVLLDIGFSIHNFNPETNTGGAFGNKFTLQYYLRKKNDSVVIRVSIQQNFPDKRHVSGNEYMAFWNQLGKARFAEIIEMSPKELY